MPTVQLSVSAVRPKVKAPGESLLMSTDFTPLLNKTVATPPVVSETINTVTITQSNGDELDALTIGAGSANDAAYLNDEGGTVVIGAGARFRVSGGEVGDYTLVVAVVTTEGNTRKVTCPLQVRET